MLRRLTIKNFALIKNLEFYPKEGLNIITGETGAGKSIIINALSLLLGKRAKSEYLRVGSKKCIVEVEFDVNSKLQNFLHKYNLDYDDSYPTLIIRREITITQSRAFINDTPVKINLLKELGSITIDLHGQHQHQYLFQKKYHLQILDRFAGIDLKKYQADFFSLQKIENKITQLLEKIKILEQERELYSYHLSEIREVAPLEGEDKDLEKKLKEMESAENLRKLLSKVDNMINGPDYSLLSSIDKIMEIASNLASLESGFSYYQKDLEAAQITITDFYGEMEKYVNNIDFSPELYRNTNSRYEQLRIILKKFGPNIEDVFNYVKKIEESLTDSEKDKDLLNQLEKEAQKLKDDLWKQAEILHQKRVKESQNFANQIMMQFGDVDLKNTKFKVNFGQNLSNLGKDGIDNISFLIKTNVGGNYGNLDEIASGGEISRVMLSIKNVISNNEDLSTLIFDEIDTGISGEVARKVGEKMRYLSKNIQIFAITHLPVIAAKADSHYFVYKKISGDETETSIQELDTKQRITAISEMIDGNNPSQATFLSAERMIQNSE